MRTNATRAMAWPSAAPPLSGVSRDFYRVVRIPLTELLHSLAVDLRDLVPVGAGTCRYPIVIYLNLRCISYSLDKMLSTHYTRLKFLGIPPWNAQMRVEGECYVENAASEQCAGGCSFCLGILGS